MNYGESICWVYSFKKYGSQLGLERILYLMKKLHNPHYTIKTIHITGTNGKGSVCKFIGSILQKAGYKVGIYLSPHLQEFSERIIINGKTISEDEIVNLIKKVKLTVDNMIQENNSPTFFEIVTAMAFQYFHDCAVDFAIIEVGLGGRFDATNIITPLVSVITNVSLEHTDYLGETIASIAFEKAGIIKKRIPVVTAAQNEAKEIIRNIANDNNASISIIDRNHWQRQKYCLEYQKFVICGIFNNYKVTTSLLGEYQGENIALSIYAIEQLQMNGIYLTECNILEGISSTFNPGRMEIISENPTMLLDGAHNPVGIQMLANSLEHDFTYNNLILIIGILRDKNIIDMLSTIAPISNQIIITQSSNERACKPEEIKNIINNIGYKKNINIKNSISDAINYAKSIANKDDLICISGSLFTVGEARSYLIPSKNKMIQC
jgi:dihydrofolate synthase/folylpolyglutamate synthase